MEATVLDARDIVERLWREAAASRERVSPPLDIPEHQPLEASEELRDVNRGWPLPIPTSLPMTGPPWKQAAKAQVAGVVLHLLDRYFRDEREFLAHVVRFDNQVAVAHDRLAAQVRKLAEQLEETSRRLFEREELLHRLLEERVERLEQRQS